LRFIFVHSPLRMNPGPGVNCQNVHADTATGARVKQGKAGPQCVIDVNALTGPLTSLS